MARTRQKESVAVRYTRGKGTTEGAISSSVLTVPPLYHSQWAISVCYESRNRRAWVYTRYR